MSQINQIIGSDDADKFQQSSVNSKAKRDLIDFLKLQQSGDLRQGLQVALDLYPALKSLIMKAISALDQGEPVPEIIKKIEDSPSPKST